MTHNNITGDKIATKAPEHCPRCGGTGHVPEQCKWPLQPEQEKGAAQ